jgi:hypothetical protein
LQLGLDDELCARALPAIREILRSEGALTRAELVGQLAESGVRVTPTGQAPAHLVFYAATRGLICRGPDRDDDEPTYVLLEQWVGTRQPAWEPDAALAELARRYIGAYGPASAHDFAAWSGIALGNARRGLALIAGELEAVEVAGEQMWVLASRDLDGAADEGAPCVRLLPRFDAYLLGYRSRELALPAQFARHIQAGGGWIHPAMIVDGRIVGTWRQQRTRDGGILVVVRPFERLDRAILPMLEAEAADVGRFLAVTATLSIEQ